MKKTPYLLQLIGLLLVSYLNSCKPQYSSSVMENQVHFINNKGVNIAYTDNGTGDTTLLFVHGWCINKSYWANQVSFFKSRYRVIAVDLPGFGQSGKNQANWTTAAFSNNLDAVINQLHLRKVVLVGHSMAGDIVLQTAIDQRKRVIGLVAVDIFKNVGIGPPPTDAEKAAYDAAIDSSKHHFRSIAFEYVNHDLFYKTTSTAVKKKVIYDMAHADTIIAAACMERNDFEEVTKLKEAGKKLYLINSDVKPTRTGGLTANHIPYQVFYVHATGHFPMIEKPHEFNSQLTKVLKSLK